MQCGVYIVTRCRETSGFWKIVPKSPRIPKRLDTYCTRTCRKPLETLILEQVISRAFGRPLPSLRALLAKCQVSGDSKQGCQTMARPNGPGHDRELGRSPTSGVRSQNRIINPTIIGHTIPKEWIVIKTPPYKGYKNELGLSKHLSCSAQTLSSLIGLVTTKTARYRWLLLRISASETSCSRNSAACDARHSWEGTCSRVVNILLGTIAKRTRLEVRIVPQEDKPIDPLRSLAGGDSGDAVSWTCHVRGQRDQQMSKTRNLEIWHCNTANCYAMTR
jgi:hypothetical protein